MSATMNHGAHSPDTVLADPAPMSLRDIRDVLDRARLLISDSPAYHDSLEVDGYLLSGRDICESLRDAESALYLVERRMK